MKTYTISRFSTGAAFPNQTDVTVEVIDTLVPGFDSKQLVSFMLSGRFDTPTTEFYAAVQAALEAAGLVDAVIADPLLKTRAAKWSVVKAERDRLESAGFPYMGRVIDSNTLSVLRINTAAIAAMNAMRKGEAFMRAWTCADYSVLLLDAEGVAGMPAALTDYAADLHAIARALYEQIEAAQTVEEVAAILWPRGEGEANA